jgi:hypothetical protein
MTIGIAIIVLVLVIGAVCIYANTPQSKRPLPPPSTWSNEAQITPENLEYHRYNNPMDPEKVKTEKV